MILLTGATGTIGGAVLRRLADRGTPLRAMTRDPSRARLPAGVDVVAGDYDDPRSLSAAVAGADAAFLATPGGPTTDRYDRALLAAARSAGVRTVVKLSSIGTGTNQGADWHRAGEDALRTSGLGWTILRPSAFASNALRWVDAVRAGGPVPNLTGTGAQGVIDPRDIAEVAADALVSDRHRGRTYTLTGPELLTVPDQVRQLAAAVGRPIGTVDVPAEAARRDLLGAGMSADHVDSVLAGLAIIRAGGNAVLSDGVVRALGRTPRSFRTWVRDHVDAFR